MKALLVDNHDSFTYNLFQLWWMVTGREPIVVANDDWDTWNSLEPDEFSAVLISPGPGRPDRTADFGISAAAFALPLPLLGVCLGHQGLCVREGATLTRAPEPVHGRTSPITHSGTELFAGIPSPFDAVRYHSLMVTHLPPSLEVTATAPGPDGHPELAMAVRHRTRPQWGVQFHPESIATGYGDRLLRNFCELAAADRGITLLPPGPGRAAGIPVGRPAGPAPDDAPEDSPGERPGELRLLTRRLEVACSGPALYSRLFAGQEHSYWLDGAGGADEAGGSGGSGDSGRSGDPGGAGSPPSLASSMSVLGGLGPHGEWVTATAGTGQVTVAAQGHTHTVSGDLFGYLRQQLAARALKGTGLPFDFALGYVGFLGYELKADSGGDAVHASDLPDAALLFSDRAVVLDHAAGQTWLLTLARDESEPAAIRWLDDAALVVAECAGPAEDDETPEPATGRMPVPVHYRHAPEQYAGLVQECLEEIRNGESYEICLTNTLTAPVRADPLELFDRLRRISPAPHAALMTFPAASVVSASPERFLRISAGGHVQAKPIKGTRRRGATPEEDAELAAELAGSKKDRAENLMIVDLLRNDLGRVAEIGSVQVTRLFDVETFATVHQLVSTIEAQLRADVEPVDCVRSAFPGGSMTGAPKRRTMQIIDRLEGGPRGVYSGALGYFSLSGAVDLSIVIRTLVVYPDRVTLGVGGAVVALSDPRAEIDEMLLKAQAPLRALATVRTEASTGIGGPPQRLTL